MDAAAAGPPSGRRDNGLPSADWGALVDLDPRLSDALLSSLASADVPAFVEPAGGHHTWTRAAQLPDRPLHRLWVDPDRADTARAVVTAEVADLSALLAELEPGATAHGFVQAVPRTAAARVLRPPSLPGPPPRQPTTGRAPATGQADGPAAGAPGSASDAGPASAAPEAAGPGSAGPAGATPDTAPDTAPRPGPDLGVPAATSGGGAAPADPDDTEVAWRQIVEGYGKDVEAAVPPWPVQEDVDPPRGRLRASRPDGEPPRRRRTDRPEPPRALPDWVEPEALDDDGHYVPPPPPPVPRLAPRKLAAGATLLVGLLLMFAPGLLLQPRTAGVALFGVLLTVGGAAALVWLMRDAPPPDSGPDDGAVV